MSISSWLETILRDARFAVRVLRRSPGFTLAALLTLGIAIGANTAVYTIVDGVLLRPLGYPDPDRLGIVTTVYRANGQESFQVTVDGRSWEAIRDHASSVDRAVFSNWVIGVNLVSPTGVAYVQQQRVGAGLFRVLGVQPVQGREFTREEDVPNGAPVAILSHAIWTSTFGSDPGIVGRTIMLRGEPYTVIGVMPERFQGSVPADVWTPLRPSTTGEGEGTNYQVVVRLKPGTTWERGRGDVLAAGTSARSQNRGSNTSLSLTPLQRGLTEELRRPLLILWAAVAVVLVIACVNLAGLQLARGTRRRREIATRMALGGGRTAVVRQILVESAVLALAGGALGVVVGAVALRGLLALAHDGLGLWQPVALDARVLGATAALSLCASVLFGLAPAIQAGAFDVQAGLSEGDTRGVAGGAARWSRRALVVGEVAMGVVLLVSAGLLTRTFVHLRGLTPGFDPSHVVTASVSLQDARYRTSQAVSQLFEETLTRIRRVPGVEAAGVGLGVPYERLLNMGFTLVDPPGDPRGGTITNMSYVTGGFFDALRIPIRRGRVIEPSDTEAGAPIAVVNEAFVRAYLRDVDNPLGRRIAVANKVREIVGTVGDVQQQSGWGDNGPVAPMPVVYVPITQTSEPFLRVVHTWFSPSWVARGGAPATVVAGIRQAVREVDPELPLAGVASMVEIQAKSLAKERFMMALVVAMGGLSLLLAALGIHGLIAGSVAERTRELGIRLALGATAGQAMRAVAVPGVVLAGIGVILGCGLAVAASGVLRHLLWGVTPNDPLTFVSVASTLLLVATAASLVPALRVLRLDPAQTLRQS
jgi:predicted permease